MRNLLGLAGIAAIAAFPFVAGSPYYLHLVVVIAIFSIVTIGLDIVFGYTGEVSVGHAALVGVGAYAAGVLAFQLNIGFVPALPVGIVVAAAFGALLALPALRVTGPYLAMVTLAFGTIVAILINEMTFLTNGPLGISLKKPLFFDLRRLADTLPFLDMSLARMRDLQFYYVVMIALLLTVVVTNRLVASRYGRAFEALRDSPIASDCMGVSVYQHKVLAFVLSAGFAGLGIPEPTATRLAEAADAVMGECILALYRSAAQPAMIEWGADAAAASARPGLFLHATEDPYVGRGRGVLQTAASMGAEVVELEGRGHWWMLEDPLGSATVLDAWVARTHG